MLKKIIPYYMKEIKFLICKLCKCEIELDLCAYDCPNDNLEIEKRKAEDMKWIICKVDREEDYNGK